MKKIVVFDEYNEIEIRPTDLLNRYLELTAMDVANLLIKNHELTNCFCPGCNGKTSVSSFERYGMQYVECVNCHTLFISPRPNDKSLHKYFSESEARKFWHNELSNSTKRKRRDKIIKPRLQWILDSTEEYLPGAQHIVDINTNQYGYVEELIETKFFVKKTFLAPFISLENIKINSSAKIIKCPLQDFPSQEEFDVVTIFEIADQIADIDTFFNKIHSILKKNGLCFMTAILISGFDLQTLWDKAETIFPPDRLNVFSVEGMRHLFERHNFECIEFSTPGILDVEIVSNTIKHHPQINLSRFSEYLLKNRGEDIKKSFQAFLQEGLLSSYGRILIRKR